MANLSRAGRCSIAACVSPIYAKRMCKAHYSAWYYAKRRKAPALCLRVYQVKACQQCGVLVVMTSKLSAIQWEHKRFCSRICSNTWKARQQRPKRSTMRTWARRYEYQRMREDTEDLAEWAERERRRQRRIRRATRPLGVSRQFIGGMCLACGQAWIDYQARQPAGYCNTCQHRRWSADSRHKRRAWKAAAKIVEVVSPDTVFRRDGYRCQICKRKTHGIHPHSRSPTIDHIIPLALGGDHSYLNVQCACFECNTRKGARSANDQLRLIA